MKQNISDFFTNVCRLSSVLASANVCRDPNLMMISHARISIQDPFSHTGLCIKMKQECTPHIMQSQRMRVIHDTQLLFLKGNQISIQPLIKRHSGTQPSS